MTRASVKYIYNEYTNERWSPVVDYPGYWISDTKRVWSTFRHRFNTGTRHRRGYIQYRLKRPDGTTGSKYLHHMMAEAFIPNPLGLPFVRHLDDDQRNNDLENLAWGTMQDNIDDCIQNGHFRYLTDEDRRKAQQTLSMGVVAINLKSGERYVFESQTEAGRMLCMDQASISRVIHGVCKHSRGWYFTKLDDEPDELPIVDLNYHRQKPWIIAIHVDTGDRFEFEGLTEASRELGVNITHVSSILRGKLKATKGWTFEYRDD